MKSIFTKGAILFFSTAFSILMAEFLVRKVFFTDIYSGSKLARQNTTTAENFFYKKYTRDNIPTHTTSSDGYVIFIGDSFTFGNEVNSNETIPYYFKKHSKEKNYEVLNLGLQATGIIDQYVFIRLLLRMNIPIKAIIYNIVENDRYINYWGFHPYEVCKDQFKLSITRPLHYQFFLAFLLDFYLSPKSHLHFKEENTEKCLSRLFEEISIMTEAKDIPLHYAFISDVRKNDLNLMDEVKLRADQFKTDFPRDYVDLNAIILSIPVNERYSPDNYHFSAKTNEALGKYLSEQIKL